MHVIKPSTDFL